MLYIGIVFYFDFLHIFFITRKGGYSLEKRASSSNYKRRITGLVSVQHGKRVQTHRAATNLKIEHLRDEVKTIFSFINGMRSKIMKSGTKYASVRGHISDFSKEIKSGLSMAVLFVVGLALFLRLFFGKLIRGVRKLWLDAAYALKDFQFSRANAVLLCGVLMVCVAGLSMFELGVEVYVDGVSFGYVENRSEFVSALQDVESRVSETLSRPYDFPENITYQLGIVNRNHMLDPEQVSDQLFSQVREVQTLYVLRIDGSIVAANKLRSSFDNVLNDVLSQYKSDDPNARVEFVHDITITQELTNTEYLRAPEEIDTILHSNIQDPDYYEIKAGDTLSAIACSYGLAQSSLLSLNPNVNTSTLAVGDELVVTEAIPYLSVKTIKTQEYTESLPYEVETVYNDSMYKSERRITTKGITGEAAVVADVTYVDGAETSRDIVSYTVTREAVNQVVTVGTKQPPARVATGNYIWPYSGSISSYFGYRWGRMHTGIDLGGHTGDAIVASDGGTVISVGYTNGYGKIVKIQHSNSIQTWYAHCSSITVSVGQKVAQGQVIAYVGNTGRSTGSHLHFEVRVNGTAVNPLTYLKSR